MKAGRKSLYTPDVQDTADAYVSGGFEEYGDMVPSIAGLSSALKVNRNTLYDWAKVHDQFKDTMEDLKSAQERLALNGGLGNKMNATIVKLLLANHGYSDKQGIEHTGAGGGPIQTAWIVQPVKAKDADTSDT